MRECACLRVFNTNIVTFTWVGSDSVYTNKNDNGMLADLWAK